MRAAARPVDLALNSGRELLATEGVAIVVTAAQGWNLHVERGPDWLFVRLYGTAFEHESELADQVWHLLEQSSTHRVVLELDEMGPLYSIVVGQLICLYKRVHGCGGLMRVCGLSAANQRVLETCRLGGYLPQYGDRNEAVMGRPSQPR